MMKRSNSFSRSAKGTSAKVATTRVAELTQLVADATADARQAESRLSTLQFRLRTEVVDNATSVLEKGATTKKAEELARMMQRGLILLKDQVDRIAQDNDGSIGGGGGVSPLESEVLVLRRELAEAKLEVARLAGENEELNHVVRRLNKQLVSHAQQPTR